MYEKKLFKNSDRTNSDVDFLAAAPLKHYPNNNEHLANNHFNIAASNIDQNDAPLRNTQNSVPLSSDPNHVLLSNHPSNEVQNQAYSAISHRDDFTEETSVLLRGSAEKRCSEQRPDLGKISIFVAYVTASYDAHYHVAQQTLRYVGCTVIWVRVLPFTPFTSFFLFHLFYPLLFLTFCVCEMGIVVLQCALQAGFRIRDVVWVRHKLGV